jgi:hypothetical protein
MLNHKHRFAPSFESCPTGWLFLGTVEAVEALHRAARVEEPQPCADPRFELVSSSNQRNYWSRAGPLMHEAIGRVEVYSATQLQIWHWCRFHNQLKAFLSRSWSAGTSWGPVVPNTAFYSEYSSGSSA